ncbi:hypothetical protein Afil01_53330 [Actinorhabdospora filicis]|uniref:DUF397 domain-containing protein n=1 Tax=Actinorhabdospora filicis TaxID=1785913 RepID=A0A9W6WCF0_9ACTN|nr:DUF397 domain-containing protein [Actinorhabdospora filicis]GLZ80526.1 hypothetical protein Afil01_53330 [Actinorhabdospora filicis]
MTPEIEVGAWRKSTRSGSGGGSNCVEVGAWRTSTCSSGDGGQCIEAGACTHGIAIRDTKDRTGPVLTVTPGNWAGFVASLTN